MTTAAPARPQTRPPAETPKGEPGYREMLAQKAALAARGINELDAEHIAVIAVLEKMPGQTPTLEEIESHTLPDRTGRNCPGTPLGAAIEYMIERRLLAYPLRPTDDDPNRRLVGRYELTEGTIKIAATCARGAARRARQRAEAMRGDKDLSRHIPSFESARLEFLADVSEQFAEEHPVRYEVDSTSRGTSEWRGRLGDRGQGQAARTSDQTAKDQPPSGLGDAATKAQRPAEQNS